MIKYFKELENKENYTILFYNNWKNETKKFYAKIPIDFFDKYNDLFKKIKELDSLYKNSLDCNHAKKFYDKESDVSCGDIENFIYAFDFNEDLSHFGITEAGKNRLLFLINIFNMDNKDDFEYYDKKRAYISYILDLFEIDNVIYDSVSTIKQYLEASLNVLKYQNKLNDSDEFLIKNAISDLKKYIVKVKTDNNLEEYTLPNSWYITPYNHLYNSMGPDGHGEATLFYPYCFGILRDNVVKNPLSYLEKINNILDNGYITKSDFNHYTHLIFDFPSILPNNFEELSDINKSIYNHLDARSYNKKIVKLVLGIISAHAGLYRFFFELKNCSNDYNKDLEYLKQFSLDEILIRCCRFHKISSIIDKTITTSCIDYENKFEEYIKRGWTIDFIPPIIFDEYDKTLKEYPTDFLKIREFRKKY